MVGWLVRSLGKDGKIGVKEVWGRGMWVDLWEWTQSEGFCLFIKWPRRQDDLVSWYQPVFPLPSQSLNNGVGTVAVMAAKHGPISQCFTDVHIAMAKCLNIPATEANTRSPIWHHPLRISTIHLLSKWLHDPFPLTMSTVHFDTHAKYGFALTGPQGLREHTSIWGLTEHLL